jgi:UPF0716 family protein affecting phage T7 exclusion
MRSLSPLTGLLAFAVWIAVEIIMFNLVASWTGGGVAFFLLIMKSVLGALFVQRAVRRKLFDLLRRKGSVRIDGPDAVAAWLKGLGGALLIAPGFGTGLAGLALLTPSVQRFLAARSGVKRSQPRDIDLEAADWREGPDPSRPRFPRRDER